MSIKSRGKLHTVCAPHPKHWARRREPTGLCYEVSGRISHLILSAAIVGDRRVSVSVCMCVIERGASLRVVLRSLKRRKTKLFFSQQQRKRKISFSFCLQHAHNSSSVVFRDSRPTSHSFPFLTLNGRRFEFELVGVCDYCCLRGSVCFLFFFPLV